MPGLIIHQSPVPTSSPAPTVPALAATHDLSAPGPAGVDDAESLTISIVALRSPLSARAASGRLLVRHLNPHHEPPTVSLGRDGDAARQEELLPEQSVRRVAKDLGPRRPPGRAVFLRFGLADHGRTLASAVQHE